jgi:hypothetical protein
MRDKHPGSATLESRKSSITSIKRKIRNVMFSVADPDSLNPDPPF